MHDHAKVGLIGASDTDSAERRVTYAHNRYENLGSRLPFQRFGYVHSYNNWFNNITGSGINPRMGGHILVENNFFENALNPVFSQSTILGQWDLRNNNARSSADNARLQHHLDGLLRQHSVPEGDQLDHDGDVPDRAAVHVHHVRARGFEVHRAERGRLGQGSAGSTGRAGPVRRHEQPHHFAHRRCRSARAASSQPVARDRERELDGHRRPELDHHLADQRAPTTAASR